MNNVHPNFKSLIDGLRPLAHHAVRPHHLAAPGGRQVRYTPREYIVLLLAGVAMPDEQPSDEQRQDGERWDGQS